MGGKPDLYPNWCFVMARAVTQFHRFARFDPAGPRLTAEEYAERVGHITARAPWRAALPLGERIAIPGYASLHEFSRAEERAVKTGLAGHFFSWIHWTNWRVVYPMPGAHQEAVAADDRPLIDFLVYDVNDPAVPGIIRFDPDARRFSSTRLYNTSVGPIRVFRMYYSPLL